VDNSKHQQQKQIKIVSNQNTFKLRRWNINSLSVGGKFKATTTKTDQVSIKQKIFKLQTTWSINSRAVGQFKATTTKTDQVSIKPKYIQITNNNETLTHFLYVDNSKQQQQKHVK